MVQLRRIITVGVSAFALALAAAPAATPTLLGANYTHTAIIDCSMDGTGILAYYDGTQVRQQLATMRQNGLETLRLLIWHMTERGWHDWGVIPSDLREPYRSNLVAYLKEVKRAGFKRLEIAFGPMWENDPGGDNWLPEKLEENWTTIKTVRQLARQYGPSTRFDLQNEGIPGPYHGHSAQLEAYVTEIWARYRKAYGTKDATVSIIADEPRIRDAKRILVPAPGYWSIHLPYDPAAADAAVLSAATILGNPLVAGETAYDDAEIGAAVKPYGMQEITEWPLRRGSACVGMSESPPFTVAGYQ